MPSIPQPKPKSLQQVVNDALNDKSLPSAQEEYKYCSVITAVLRYLLRFFAEVNPEKPHLIYKSKKEMNQNEIILF